MGDQVEPEVPASGHPPVPWVTPGKAPADGHGRRSPVARVALVSTVLWVVVGVLLAYVSARVGAPGSSGTLALVSGIPVLVIVGRRAGLHSRSSWVRALVLTLVFALLVFGVVIFAYSILLYG